MPLTMPSRRSFSLTLVSLLPGLAAAEPSAPAVWVSGEIPPYLRRGAKGPEGYAYALFQRVIRQAALPGELHFYPWARALRMLEARQAQAALVMARSADREARFRWLFPVGSFRFAVISRTDGSGPPGDIASLRDRRVAVLRGSVSRGLLAVAGVHQIVDGKDYADLTALLRRGVVDAIVGPGNVVLSISGTDGLHVAPLDPVHEFHAAAGPAMSDATVQRIRAAYQQLVDSGAVAQLRKHHPGAFSED